MSSQTFGFSSFRLAAPRRRRLSLLRFTLGLIGVVVLCLLLVFGFFVGAAMLAIGFTAKRLLAKRRKPLAVDATAPHAASRGENDSVIEGEYRIVR